ncbi:hypothetical protein [uncultured Arthrobacter sp.]|uniref:hypothetical protein n=1 Tax=uncultured Arthrobacter sp. TaxID=114050 RepID=UPI0026209481|nr:hypothetical protein [uncultured Arthrobacter sp.]
MGKSRITPGDKFPENLNQLEDSQVEVLNSKVHRQIEVEYVEEGTPDPETEHRQEELNEELDDRDLLSDASTQQADERSQNDDDGGRPAAPEGSAEHSSERR